MNELQIIHYVEPESRLRAELARTTFSLGFHAEVYADLAELSERSPRRGVIALHEPSGIPGHHDEPTESDDSNRVARALDYLADRGVWLPLVVMTENPSTSRVVTAIKAGALDYLPLPLERARLAAMLERIGDEARAHAEARRRMIEARSRIGNLSAREREVLDWLTRGCSNKSIARQLAISPRTVEIHRANMMVKLGASHPAEAVRLRLEARLEAV